MFGTGSTIHNLHSTLLTLFRLPFSFFFLSFYLSVCLSVCLSVLSCYNTTPVSTSTPLTTGTWSVIPRTRYMYIYINYKRFRSVELNILPCPSLQGRHSTCRQRFVDVRVAFAPTRRWVLLKHAVLQGRHETRGL